MFSRRRPSPPSPSTARSPRPPEPQVPLDEFHRAIWRDPESAPRALIAADGALSAKMKTWLEENIAFADKDVMGAPTRRRPR